MELDPLDVWKTALYLGGTSEKAVNKPISDVFTAANFAKIPRNLWIYTGKITLRWKRSGEMSGFVLTFPFAFLAYYSQRKDVTLAHLPERNNIHD
jgi:hypothetical protein